MTTRPAGVVDILMVEDNPGDVRLTREAFDQATIDFAIHVVTDGDAALDFLFQRGAHTDAPRPELVLLDLNLPRLNGQEVLKSIRDDPELTRIPVIVLTSSDDEDDVVRSYQLQANAYLKKPVDPAKFDELVRFLEEFWFGIAQLPSTTE